MISFMDATDEELIAFGRAVDALTLEQPMLVFEDNVWFRIVHAFMNEVRARSLMEQLIMETEGGE